MADNKMPFVTSKALKRTPATKENKDRIMALDRRITVCKKKRYGIILLTG